jgi:hypothetical protein
MDGPFSISDDGAYRTVTVTESVRELQAVVERLYTGVNGIGVSLVVNGS